MCTEANLRACYNRQCSKSAEADLVSILQLFKEQQGSSMNEMWNFRLNSDAWWGSLGDRRAGLLTSCSNISPQSGLQDTN